MYTTEGIILKKQDVGEADALFTIYTKDFGKIRAVAQGIKKEGAKLKGHLEPLSLSLIGFVLGRSGERLTHALLLAPWHSIKGDYSKIQAAWQIATAIDQHCFNGEKDENLWTLVLGSLALLEKGVADAEFFRAFEKRLHECLGYAAKYSV